MLVVDASVAVKFVTEEPGSDAAYEIVIGPEPLIAPDWIIAECANAIGKKVLRGELDRRAAETSFAELPRFFAKLVPAEVLLDQAFQLSLDLGHAIYDCLYLILALREDGLLVTADTKFGAAARRAGYGARIRLLGEVGNVDD